MTTLHYHRAGLDSASSLSSRATLGESRTPEQFRDDGWKSALPALLLLALTLRIVAAFQPGFHHPDAVYQYLEPAFRLLTGDGVVTWEWRVGMRGWLLPWLFAAPMAVGRAIDAAGPLPLLLPRLLVASCSLGIVWGAWSIGARVSRTHALVAGFVAATWFELIHFGAQTLSEPLATAALIPAAALLIDPRRVPARHVLAGALLGLAVLARPQYAPAAAVLALVAIGRDWRALPPVILGGLAALGIGAIADLAAGATPLAWIVENVRENLVAGKAARFGVSPPWAFLGWWGYIWRWATAPILLGLVAGRRRCPALFWAALANLALHSLIGHKEYRFVVFTTASLVILASLGWADWLVSLKEHRTRWTVAVLACAGLGSLVLGTTGVGADVAARNRAGATLFADIARDPASCGVAIVGFDWSETPGESALGTARPLSVFLRDDPLLARHFRDVPARRQRGFTDIVAPIASDAIPAGYARGACEARSDDTPICRWSRPGPCASTAGSPFAINTLLARGGR